MHHPRSTAFPIHQLHPFLTMCWYSPPPKVSPLTDAMSLSMLSLQGVRIVHDGLFGRRLCLGLGGFLVHYLLVFMYRCRCFVENLNGVQQVCGGYWNSASLSLLILRLKLPRRNIVARWREKSSRTTTRRSLRVSTWGAMVYAGTDDVSVQCIC